MNGKSFWLQPFVVHKIGDIEYHIELFLYMDNDGMINIYAGYKEIPDKYASYFS